VSIPLYLGKLPTCKFIIPCLNLLIKYSEIIPPPVNNAIFDFKDKTLLFNVLKLSTYINLISLFFAIFLSVMPNFLKTYLSETSL
jgi:hypothetical protein